MSARKSKLPDVRKVSYRPQPSPIDPVGPTDPIGGIWRPPFGPPIGDPMPWVYLRGFLEKRELIAITKIDIEHRVNQKRLETQAIKNEMVYLSKVKAAIGRFK